MIEAGQICSRNNDTADDAREFVNAAEAALRNGRSVDQTVAELRLPDKYKEYHMDGARAAIETIAAELQETSRVPR